MHWQASRLIIAISYVYNVRRQTSSNYIIQEKKEITYNNLPYIHVSIFIWSTKDTYSASSIVYRRDVLKSSPFVVAQNKARFSAHPLASWCRRNPFGHHYPWVWNFRKQILVGLLPITKESVIMYDYVALLCIENAMWNEMHTCST